MNHVWHECHCNQVGCMFCDGGLSSCDVCRLIEGSLTTECCGENAWDKNEEIYAGKLDFKDGKWVNAPSIHSPEYHRRRAEELKHK